MNAKTIMLIEDNPDDEELTRLAFKRNHILNDVVTARDGAEALEYLFGTGLFNGRDLSQMPDIILLDLKLPRLSGHEVLQRLRTDPRTRLIPVIVLTSSNEREDILTSYRLGANSFVRKPVDFQCFVDAVRVLSHYWLLINENPPFLPSSL
jgi:CheY-like chemotaxis protein